MKYQGSNFVTPAGLVILVILILVSAFLNMPGLEALLVAVLLLSLAAFLWAKFALRRIFIQVSDPQIRAFPGAPMETRLTLKNHKYLMLTWLEAALPLEGSACIAASNDTDPVLKARFHWIMPRQTLSWVRTARAKQRGVVRFETIDLTSGDGFGLCSATKKEPLSRPLEFIVYPKVHEVSLQPILSRLKELELHKNGFYTDPTLISSVRNYQPGDSMRSINWRQLARTGQVMVNVNQAMQMNRFCLIPDLASYSYKTVEKQSEGEKVVTKVREKSFEEMLSLLASIIVAAQDRQLNCSLVIPGYGHTPPQIIIPENRDAQVPELLTALARIDYRGEETLFPELAMDAEQHLLGRCFLFTGKNGSRGLSFPHLSVMSGARQDFSGESISGKEFCP